MKKWMKICLMAAASAMLLAGCGTKDNTAETTAVETTAKAEELKSINADYIFETVGELKNHLMKNTNQKPEEAPIP